MNLHLVKSRQNVNECFVAVSKPLAGAGLLKKICKDACRVADAVQDTYPSEMLGCILVHQTVRFAKMVLRDRCSTSHDLASLFLWHTQYSTQMVWKNRKKKALATAASSALNVSFLNEVSQSFCRY